MASIVKDHVTVVVLEKTVMRNVIVSIVAPAIQPPANAIAHRVGMVKNAKVNVKNGISVKIARSSVYVRKTIPWHATIKQENASAKLKVEEVKR